MSEEGQRLASAHPVVGACIDNDDWGFKTQTLLSTRQMRQYVFPWHKRIVDAVHAEGKPVLLHSCGHFERILDDMVELGIDARHSYEDIILPVEQAYPRLIDKFAPEDSNEGLGNGSQDEPPAPLTEQYAKFLSRIRSTWAEVGDDPEKRKLLATKSGLSLSTIAAVTQGHIHLPPSQIKKLRDDEVPIRVQSHKLKGVDLLTDPHDSNLSRHGRTCPPSHHQSGEDGPHFSDE